ncbi:MAG TPA: HDIG domain-containing protein [Syntrophomonadaceae bacterium]|nr:HDIG domain-containing protein [Syntrophomonadaceae bacterium]
MANIAGFLWKKITALLLRSTSKKLIGVLLFFSITILILFSSFNPQQIVLRSDEVARRNIQSNITAVVIDQKQTADLKDQAEHRVQKVYLQDKYALANTKNDIASFFASAGGIISTTDDNKQAKLEALLTSTNKKPDLKLEDTLDQLAQYLAERTPQEIELMRKACLDVGQALMEQTITEDALPATLELALKQVDEYDYSGQARQIMKIVVVNSIRANMLYNQDATAKAVQEARDSVQPVQKTVKAGEIIVREGERVTPEQISTLEQLGILRSKNYPLTLLGSGIFVLLTFWLTLEQLRRHHPKIYGNDRLMFLIGLIFILILVTSRAMTAIHISDQAEVNALVGFLAPVAAGSMLAAILLDNRLAVFLTMIMALYVGLINDGNQLDYGIVAFLGGAVGIFQVYRLNQTSDLAKSGIYIALVDIVAILDVLLIRGGRITWDVAWMGACIGAVNGILSAVLMIGALPFLEGAFSITSMIKLLELSNPNHELLKRLLLEAPGTYHHSLMVANLAEASAESIGANPLVVRAGAYYHDIGKIKRPEYFVENQRSFESPHEKIAPALSALIITSHVRDGVDLAREARLPQLILDFIEQHHGTGLARYFYSRALEEDREGNLSEESFRYEGPKPQSKEVALVMLADTVEAGVRSLQDPSPARINNMVRVLIKEKLNDGQLESCDLTFKDLDIISDSFCKILEGVYHKRIEYPETIVKELEKRREKHGDHDYKPAEQSPIQ